jgi:hypothetical protein
MLKSKIIMLIDCLKPHLIILRRHIRIRQKNIHIDELSTSSLPERKSLG